MKRNVSKNLWSFHFSIFEEHFYLMIYNVLVVRTPLLGLGGWVAGSGERPLCYVLFCQVIVQVSSQSTNGHRRHVAGAAICQMRNDRKKVKSQLHDHKHKSKVQSITVNCKETREWQKIKQRQTYLEVSSPSSSPSYEAAAVPAAHLQWSETWCSLWKYTVKYIVNVVIVEATLIE